MSSIGRRQVHDFICSDLVSALRRDLRAFKLVREADVECATYMHLRAFLDSDPTWTVLARRHVPQTGYFVDLVLFEGKKPRIAIEIKWGRTSFNEKDRRSLGAAITELGVNKAYWLSASVVGREPLPFEKAEHEKNSLFQVCVRAELNDSERMAWEKAKDSYRSGMRNGTGSKQVAIKQREKV